MLYCFHGNFHVIVIGPEFTVNMFSCKTFLLFRSPALQISGTKYRLLTIDASYCTMFRAFVLIRRVPVEARGPISSLTHAWYQPGVFNFADLYSYTNIMDMYPRRKVLCPGDLFPSGV